MKAKKSARFWVAIALVLCLISSVGASIAQTDGGFIEYHDVTMVTDSGHELDALLLIPETATPENPAPAIVTSHGWYNNREMQDLNYVEYARRGYVVIAISMYGHGDSEVLENGTWWNDENNGNGMYDAVKYLSRLPMVDASRIGVTGHSNGGLACRESMLQDEEGLIAAALIVSNDSVYYDDDGNFANPFGSRDVGVVACQYDEFFHRVKLDDGSKSAPRDYIDQVTAQSFLHYGQDPAGLDARAPYTYYEENVDGEDAIRVIFNPPITHPWAHFSKHVVSISVDFFDRALGAPVKLDNDNQIWQWKAVFNTIGLIGFFMFAIYAAIALTETSYFAELKANEEVKPLPAPTGKGKAWYWGGFVVSAIFAIIAYLLLYTWCNAHRPAFWNQAPTWYIGMWTFACGLFTIVVLCLSYNFNAKVDLVERGIKMPIKKLGKSILLAITVVAASFALVFISDYLFKTDYRLWCFATIRAFAPMHYGVIAKYLIFWIVYYVALSVATNGFNYVKLGKKECGCSSLLVQMFFVFIGPEIMIAVQYLTFYNSGFMWTEATGLGGSIIGIWLYPIVFILPLATFVCRKIYDKTKNPYIGGIIMGLIACIMSVTNTLTLG